MSSHDFPLMEFDPSRDAVVDPARAITPFDVPESFVFCFLQDAIAGLVNDIDGAEKMLERALELLGEMDAIEVAEARRELAMCRKDADPASAEELLRSAAELFERSEERSEFAATRRLLGDLLLERGDVEAAAQAYRDGIVAVEERL